MSQHKSAHNIGDAAASSPAADARCGAALCAYWPLAWSAATCEPASGSSPTPAHARDAAPGDGVHSSLWSSCRCPQRTATPATEANRQLQGKRRASSIDQPCGSQNLPHLTCKTAAGNTAKFFNPGLMFPIRKHFPELSLQASYRPRGTSASRVLYPR